MVVKTLVTDILFDLRFKVEKFAKGHLGLNPTKIFAR